MITIDPPSPAFASKEKAALTRFLNRVRTLLPLAGEVDVLLTGDAGIKRLNRNYRGKNKATDVLSFPSAPEMAGLSAGDLALSLETAQRQADEHGHALLLELKILTLHGLLHLAGEDHETDRGEMAAREAALRGRLKLPANLIARAAGSTR